MIQLSGLDVFYGTEQVLKNINLNIKKHEILALIGPSGCGKSTLLYAINRLLEERGGRALGSIMLDNTDILSADPQEVRQRIGMVFQNPCPFPFSVAAGKRFFCILDSLRSIAGGNRKPD